eukprot:CAMPEP_0201285228 /NCGR_PEP_ID=MMETSP1317-20130820/99249_1 /ASSEMBLY_ACC=CAM_ASM_000770 /TAXON_ID=187299 /ORGANISM="Undescribed Undescribed, Strain Undescribed" /LENGTH=36 /DNA_ID= /DNA_START= /DNA_END= /DNA_ORIENTATION=
MNLNTAFASDANSNAPGVSPQFVKALMRQLVYKAGV